MLFNWCIHPHALSANITDNIVKFVEQNYKLQKGLVDKETNILHSHRKSDIAWLGPDPSNNYLRDLVWGYIQEANRQGFGFDIQYLPALQYTVYKAEDGGHYGWHTDMSFVNNLPYTRKLSFTLQLSDSDEYEGGDFEIEDQYNGAALANENIRGKGTIIIFPSFASHRITPVTKGIRRSLVAWAEGPKFR